MLRKPFTGAYCRVGLGSESFTIVVRRLDLRYNLCGAPPSEHEFGKHEFASVVQKGWDMPGEVGEVAPDFKLPSVSEGDITLSQYKGQKHVVLSFHVFDFTSG